MGVSFITATHEIADSSCRGGRVVSAPVTIEDGCWIGANVTILPGVTVGAGSVIAAGAVVVSTLAPNGLYGGVPARLIRELP
ncbi:acyltransferase [Demequina silvatica]|nr:DapH/DapD/GlmU-related protein [Demequina silvatica]